MMWSVMTYGGPTISLSAPDAAGAAAQFAMTHGMSRDVKAESCADSCSLFSSGGVPIVVSRRAVSTDQLNNMAIALHNELRLDDDDDTSFDAIVAVLEKLSPDSEYGNVN